MSAVFAFVHLFVPKATLLFSLCMLFSNLIVPALRILDVYAYVHYVNVYACSVQPEATHQLTSTPPWPMASPSTVLGLPGQSTHSSTGWALSQVDDRIFFYFLVTC